MYHFSEQIINSNVEFDYKLKKGSSTIKNAIMNLKINSYPHNVAAEALNLSENFEKICFDTKNET
jgi:DNA mismatch repair ATPase MutS